ncbi:MAG: hypothetical protein ACYC4K_08505 [Thiobacillus sp.]
MARDQKVLLVDSQGQHARSTRTQFIFGWQQQLAQHRLQTLWVNGVEVMHAPGAEAGDAMIVRASMNYHALLFDGYALNTEIALATSMRQVLLVALDAHPDTLTPAYALIKTLHQYKLDWQVILIGDAATSERIKAAVAYFLPAQSDMPEYINLNADAHLHALAAKISAADSGIRMFDNNTEEDCAQHG